MSVLHQCNNCMRTQPSPLQFQIEPTYPTLSDPPDMEFCSWLCIYDYAGKKVSDDPSARDTLERRGDGRDADRVDGAG